MLSPSPLIQSAPASRTVPVIVFVFGSIRTTLPNVWSLTQSAPRYAVSPFGSVPTLNFLTTFPLVMRHTVPSPAFATHTDPYPHSMSYGWKPTGTRVVTLAVFVSTRTAVDSALSIDQTAPGAAARLKTRAPTVTRVSTLPVAGSTRITSPLPRPPTHTLPPPVVRPKVGLPICVVPAGPARRVSSAAAISFISSYATALRRLG